MRGKLATQASLQCPLARESASFQTILSNVASIQPALGKHIRGKYIKKDAVWLLLRCHSTQDEIWSQKPKYAWPQCSEIGRSNDRTHREHFYRAINSIWLWTLSCRLLKYRLNIFVSTWLVREETIVVCGHLAACKIGGPLRQNTTHGNPRTQQNCEGYRSAGSQATVEETSGNIVGLDV